MRCCCTQTFRLEPEEYTAFPRTTRAIERSPDLLFVLDVLACGKFKNRVDALISMLDQEVEEQCYAYYRGQGKNFVDEYGETTARWVDRTLAHALRLAVQTESGRCPPDVDWTSADGAPKQASEEDFLGISKVLRASRDLPTERR